MEGRGWRLVQGSSRLWIPRGSKLQSKLKGEYLLVHSHPLIPCGADQRWAFAFKKACCYVKWVKPDEYEELIYFRFYRMSNILHALICIAYIFSYFLIHCSLQTPAEQSDISDVLNQFVKFQRCSDHSHKPPSWGYDPWPHSDILHIYRNIPLWQLLSRKKWNQHSQM